MKLQNPENKAFAQMFQKNYAGKILECHLNLLNVIRVGGYLPDRVINLILQYLSNRFEIILCYFFLLFNTLALLAVVSLFIFIFYKRLGNFIPTIANMDGAKLWSKHIACYLF